MGKSKKKSPGTAPAGQQPSARQAGPTANTPATTPPASPTSSGPQPAVSDTGAIRSMGGTTGKDGGRTAGHVAAPKRSLWGVQAHRAHRSARDEADALEEDEMASPAGASLDPMVRAIGIAFIVIAIVGVVVVAFSKLSTPQALRSPVKLPDDAISSRITPYLPVLGGLIVVCVLIALWGLYLSERGKAAHYEREIADLQLENARSRGQTPMMDDSGRGTTAGRMPAAASSGPRQPVPPPPPPVERPESPPPIGKLAPPKGHTAKNPPGYEEEKRDHPHILTYPTDKTPPLAMGWWVIGASRRGRGHEMEGKFREDDFAVRRIGDRGVLVAIADGVSSKAYSRRGARAAVRGATDPAVILDKSLERFAYEAASQPDHPSLADRANDLLMRALQGARIRVEHLAGTDPDLKGNVDELHSTLMAFLAVPHKRGIFVAGVQIGDGVLFARRAVPDAASGAPREWWMTLLEPQIQASGNEVQPFMRTQLEQWKQHFRCEPLLPAGRLLAMTDGTADDIEPDRPSRSNPDPDPYLYVEDFYQHTRQALGQPDMVQAAAGLADFLGYDKQQSFDDRTVVCLDKRP